MDSKYYFREQFKIRANEVDTSGKAKLHALCNLLQEVAGNHALSLNYDISQLMEKDLTWVLHRLHIVMDRLPQWREHITIETWPSSGDKLRAYRDFLIRDEAGHEIGRCLSYWLMLNIKSRRPVRMPEEILAMAPKDIKHVLPVKTKRLSGFTEPDNTSSFSVRQSDLDLNNHVNNVQYISWALETLPQDLNIKELDIEFHAECLMGDVVLSESKPVDNIGFKHQLLKEPGNKMVALAEGYYTP